MHAFLFRLAMKFLQKNKIIFFEIFCVDYYFVLLCCKYHVYMLQFDVSVF